MSDVLRPDDRWLRDHPTTVAPVRALIDRLVREMEARAIPCVWTEDSDGECWETTCKQAFSTTTGEPPSKHSLLYCGFCGHPIKERPYKYEESSDE